MRIFHFGEITENGKTSFGKFALHIQCPWRIENSQEIITGRMDLYEPAGEVIDCNTMEWDSEKENLQDKKILELFKDFDFEAKSSLSKTKLLTVESVDSDNHGGAIIRLSGGYTLVLFPSGSTNEDWRLFIPNNLDSHFVVEGGKII